MCLHSLDTDDYAASTRERIIIITIHAYKYRRFVGWGGVGWDGMGEGSKMLVHCFDTNDTTANSCNNLGRKKKQYDAINYSST